MPQAKKDHHDEEDVPAALERGTADGSGFASEDELPDSDFVSFAEEGVEEDVENDEEIAQ